MEGMFSDLPSSRSVSGSADFHKGGEGGLFHGERRDELNLFQAEVFGILGAITARR
jgi:hypothetical protein